LRKALKGILDFLPEIREAAFQAAWGRRSNRATRGASGGGKEGSFEHKLCWYP
jgi:hypothetical protein